MKNEAERRGAELAPTSLTAGMSEGNGVVSMSTCWENLMDQSVSQLSGVIVPNCTRWRFPSKDKRYTSIKYILGPSSRHDAGVLRS
jgi:hypothetical protein